MKELNSEVENLRTRDLFGYNSKFMSQIPNLMVHLFLMAIIKNKLIRYMIMLPSSILMFIIVIKSWMDTTSRNPIDFYFTFQFLGQFSLGIAAAIVI
jgi:hypothetical protein